MHLISIVRFQKENLVDFVTAGVLRLANDEFYCELLLATSLRISEYLRIVFNLFIWNIYDVRFFYSVQKMLFLSISITFRVFNLSPFSCFDKDSY